MLTIEMCKWNTIKKQNSFNFKDSKILVNIHNYWYRHIDESSIISD